MADLYPSLKSDHDRAWELLNSLTGGAGDYPPGPSRRRRLAQQLVSLLSAHELSEELVVWPAVRRFCREGTELAAVALEQERNLRRALNELSSISPSQEFDECVNTVAAQARTHFSYEQSQAWPRLADSLSAVCAYELAGRWRIARATAATKPHPHVPADPRVLGPAMPLLSAVDRMRGALQGQVSLPGR